MTGSSVKSIQLDEPRLWLYRPWTQLGLISFICFCCPGMYNSISGIGGSGQLDQTAAANATVALLASTAAAALTIVPPVFDAIGPRGCLLLSGWTYALYSGSLLCYNHTRNAAFVIASGAILGVGAAFLWIAQGDIMIAYPPESEKGRAIALFWVIFNVGGSVGGFMSFGLNYHSKAGTVKDNTYIAFMAVIIVGWLLSVFIVPPSKVIRADGSHAQRQKSTKSQITFQNQIKTTLAALSDWRILALAPMFFGANLPYSYQQNVVNGDTFTIRSRSLNSALYWFAQIFGALFIGFILDIKALRRSHRAKLGWFIMIVLTFVIFGGGYSFQKWQDRVIQHDRKKGWLDFSAGRAFVGPCFLYFFYGFYDAAFQALCYWMMGSLSNSPTILARYVGLYKTFQATGGAMAWRINALKKPAMTQFAMNWGVLAGGLFIALPTVLVITDTNTSETDSDLVETDSQPVDGVMKGA